MFYTKKSSEEKTRFKKICYNVVISEKNSNVYHWEGQHWILSWMEENQTATYFLRSRLFTYDIMKNFNCNISLWFLKSKFRFYIENDFFSIKITACVPLNGAKVGMDPGLCINRGEWNLVEGSEDLLGSR